MARGKRARTARSRAFAAMVGPKGIAALMAQREFEVRQMSRSEALVDLEAR